MGRGDLSFGLWESEKSYGNSCCGFLWKRWINKLTNIVECRLEQFIIPPNTAYLRLKSSFAPQNLYLLLPKSHLGRNFRPIGVTFGRRPLRGPGSVDSDLKGQMLLKDMKLDSRWPLKAMILEYRSFNNGRLQADFKVHQTEIGRLLSEILRDFLEKGLSRTYKNSIKSR